MCRLYFADIYARKTEGFPRAMPAPGVGSTLREVEGFLPDLEAKMIEFVGMGSHTSQPRHSDCQNESPPPSIHVRQRILVLGVLPRPQSYSLFGQRRILHQNY